jgi:hypothetical protein
VERQFTTDQEAEEIIALTRKEIELYREHSDEYGDQFFLLKNMQ